LICLLCLHFVIKMNLLYLNKFLQNPKVKLYSFLTALLLWFYIVTDNQFTHTVDVTLRLINQPVGWILIKPIPDKAEIQIRGSGKNLIALISRDLYIDLDMEQREEDMTFPISLDAIEGMPKETSIQPLRVMHPTSVEVRLDRFATKKVPVRSQIVFDLIDGYIQVGEVDLEPDSAIISGPKSLVDAMDYVFTDSVKFDNVLKEIRGKVELAPPDVETLKYSSQTVRFQCDVQRIGERVITEIPVTVTHVPRNLKVTVVPSTFSLKFQGGSKILSRLKITDIVATIDYRSRRRYQAKKIPANILHPLGIYVVESRPSSFELFVE
jgi:YbbR domain-containing protein